MSRVYGAEAIINHTVPAVADFNEVLASFREYSESAVAAGSVVTALVYGSVARGSYTRRSDFDCMLVCTSEADLPSARTICTAAGDAADKRVQINASVYTFNEISAGQYENDRFFSAHLTDGKTLFTGINPRTYLAYNKFPAVMLFADYIRNKKRRLNTAYVSSDESECLKGVERMLELPLAIGRKLLPVIAEMEDTEPPRFDSADKLEVSRYSFDLFRELDVEQMATTLLLDDAAYTDKLHDALEERISPEEYQFGLDSLIERIPHALKWLNQVDRAVSQRFEATGNDIV